MKNLDATIGKITGFFHIIGTILMMVVCLVFATAILSRPLGIGIMGLDELAGVLAVLMTFMGIAYVMREGKHINLDTAINMLGPRKRKAVDWFNNLVMVFVCALMIWQGLRLGIHSLVQQDTTYFMGFPYYIIRLAVPFGMILFLIEVCLLIAHSVVRKPTVKKEGV